MFEGIFEQRLQQQGGDLRSRASSATFQVSVTRPAKRSCMICA
jgi:hypothetical protein